MRRSSVQTADLTSDLLKRIRASHGVSRADLARALGLSGSTAGVYVDRLMKQGFVTEAAGRSVQAGRPPKLLHLNARGGEFIGVDFEARSILAVAVDFAEKPLRFARKRIEKSDSVEQIIAKTQEAAVEVLPADTSRVLAIGLGVPGIVDPAAGTAVRYEHIPKWRNVPLGPLFRQRFDVPVFIENTMRAMALAELWFGQGRGSSDFACVCVRSGLGAGIVSNGELLRGARHSAGELGLRLCRPAIPETAALFGLATDAEAPLQEIASARSLQAAAAKAMSLGRRTSLRQLGRLPSIEDLVEAAGRRDGLTLQLLEEIAVTLGFALADLVLTINPARIIVAGQLAAFGDLLLNPLTTALAQRLEHAGVPAPDLVNSTLGEHAGALGAAALALHEWKPR